MQGADLSHFNFSVYHMPEFIQESFFRHNLKIFKEVVNETWPDGEKYLKRIDRMIEECTERGQKVFRPSAGYSVLNHGDFVLRNMLFQKSEDKVTGLQFVDFQLSVLASPAVDLTMALYGAMTLANRRKYRDEIILFYHEEFVKTLKAIGYEAEPPSLKDLHVELVQNGALAAQMSICYMPYLFAEWQMVNSDRMYCVNDDSEKFKRSLYESAAFQDFIREELPIFYYKGFI